MAETTKEPKVAIIGQIDQKDQNDQIGQQVQPDKEQNGIKILKSEIGRNGQSYQNGRKNQIGQSHLIG